MNLNIDYLQGQYLREKTNPLNSERSLASVDKPTLYTDLSTSGVREKLISTRRLLENTLQKKNRYPGNYGKKSSDLINSEECLHNELKKPDFEQLSHIYEHYMKAPVKEQTQHKSHVVHRSTSAPSVWQKTKEKLLQEKEESFKRECPFKPTINRIPHSKNLDDTGQEFNRDEWFKSLARPKNEIIEQREKIKREEEDNKNCNFRPTITSFRSIASSSYTPVEERLYCNGENKQLKRERLKREKDEKEASSFPFSPQVSNSIAGMLTQEKYQQPLYKRLDEVQQERALLKQQAIEKKEKSDNLSFKPHISEKSRTLAENKCVGNITERLSREKSQSKYQSMENPISLSVSNFNYFIVNVCER